MVLGAWNLDVARAFNLRISPGHLAPLDILGNLPFIACMKAAYVVCLFLGFAVDFSLAQSNVAPSIITNTAAESTITTTATEVASPIVAPAVSPLLLERVTVKPDVIETKNLRFSGPAVAPFKAKRLREVPRRVLHAINPFAKQEEPPEFEGLPRVTSQAWTTTVGWHPGASAFADPVTHESRLGLISISRPTP
jgi:hypothetical protein